MLIFYIIIGIVYALFLRYLSRSWKVNDDNCPTAPSNELVTLIVPFRNEEHKLQIIFESIEKLNAACLQILWVNDHSEDASVDILARLLSTPDLRFDHKIIHSERKGKKSAVETAVNHTKGDFIFATDADCELPYEWINQLMTHFKSPHVQLVAGPVMTKESDTVFQRFQQIDWASILLVTQYAIAHQSPLMCSGANLAYRKQAFQKVNGYQGNRHILSGDDEFLMKKIGDEYGVEALVYANRKEALVFTNAALDWAELFSQRVRWASKYKSHNCVHFLSAFFPAVLQLFWFISFVLPFTYGLKGLSVFVIVWMLKISMEYFSFRKVTKTYALILNPLDLFFTSMIHPFYVLRIAIGVVFGHYRWKGRSQ